MKRSQITFRLSQHGGSQDLVSGENRGVFKIIKCLYAFNRYIIMKKMRGVKNINSVETFRGEGAFEPQKLPPNYAHGSQDKNL